MTRRWWQAGIVVAVAAGAWLVGRSCGGPPPPPPVVIHDSTGRVVAERPTAERPPLVRRITQGTVRPQRIVVTTTTPDTTRVRAFARKVFEAESLRAELTRLREAGLDTTAVRETPRLLPPASGTYDGRTLSLWLSRTDGSVLAASARLAPRWSFVSGAGGASDTVPIFRGDRAWVRAVRETARCTLPAAVLALGGALLSSKDRVTGAAVGGGAGLLGCLSD